MPDTTVETTKIIIFFSFFINLLGGVADRVGGLKRGDQLLSVNGVSVEGEHHEKAVELLKQVQQNLNAIVPKHVKYY